jgi:hypothetical protein
MHTWGLFVCLFVYLFVLVCVESRYRNLYAGDTLLYNLKPATSASDVSIATTMRQYNARNSEFAQNSDDDQVLSKIHCLLV